MCAKVLVADDSGVMRKIIIRTLTAAGVSDIVEAGDGDQALARFNEQPFDLVLSDWNMPGMSGLDFLKAVRGQGSTTPFVLITTEGDKSRVIEAIQAGVSDFVVKPFESSVLLEKVSRFVESVGVS